MSEMDVQDEILIFDICDVVVVSVEMLLNFGPVKVLFPFLGETVEPVNRWT